MFKNKYAKPCSVCKENVPVGAGMVEGPPWVTYCQQHTPAQPARAPQGYHGSDRPDDSTTAGTTMPAAVRIEPFENDQVRVAPASFLGDKFEDFKATSKAAGVAFDFERRLNHAPARALVEIVAAYKGAGFTVILDPSLQASLQAEAASARQASAAADERITEIRARLATRGRALFPFQESGVAFLAERPCAMLGDDMGLGKTVQALLSLPPETPVLVVCPKNVKRNWLNEARSWRPDLTGHTLDGLQAIRYWPRPGELCSVAYVGMNDELPAGQPHVGTVLIADEAHRLKGKRTRQRERWEKLRDAVLSAGGRVWLLTGSPLVNELNELATVLEAANLVSQAWGDKKAFKKSALNDPVGYQRKLRTVMLRRERDEVQKDLPPIVYQDVPVEISAETKAELDGILKAMIERNADRKVQDLRKSPDYGKLTLAAAKAREEEVRLAAEGAAEEAIELAFDGRLPIPFELISRCKALLALAKAPSAFEILDDMLEGAEADVKDKPAGTPGELWTGGRTFDDPVVFVSAHLEPVRQVLTDRAGWGAITGEVSDMERDRLIKKFQAGGLAGMCLTIRAGGEGITLTRSSRMLVNDPEWTPKDMDQVEARLKRIGAQGQDRDGTGKRTILVVRMVAEHVIDRRIHEILDEKRGLIKKFVAVATVGADHRAESVAVAIDAALQGVQTGALPAGTMFARRPANGERESAALSWAQNIDDRDEFIESLARQAASRGGLTDKQWQALLNSFGKARPDAASVVAPRTARERWAAEALLTLAGMDTDRARELNDVGFNKIDGGRGHAMAGTVSQHGGLPAQQWPEAIKLVWKYQRQVGAPPANEPTVGGAA